MRLPSDFMMTPTVEIRSDRRRAGRLRTEDLRSTLGQVYDLSSTGVGVVRRGRKIGSIGDGVMIRLSYLDHDLIVSCRIMRIERLGFRRHRYGLQFVEVSPEAQATICRLARDCADKKLFEPVKM